MAQLFGRNPGLKAFMLPGGPLLPLNPAIRFFLRVGIHFPIAVWLWQSSGKVEKLSCVLLRLDAL
jgi:hypothetical protein